MSILAKVTSLLGGGIFDSVVDVAKSYFPPNMSDKERGEAELALLAVKADTELKLSGVMRDIQEMYETRIREMEGTAGDLKTIPFVGPVIIFFRGMQRPVWGFAVLYLDWMVFSGEWKIVDESRQDTAFLIINLLVLSFLFGERAIKNLSPLIERLVKR
jgi:hypothetical protein